MNSKEDNSIPNPDTIISSNLCKTVAQVPQPTLPSANTAITVAPRVTAASIHCSNDDNGRESDNTRILGIESNTTNNVMEYVRKASNGRDNALWAKRNSLVVPIGGEKGETPFLITKIIQKIYKAAKNERIRLLIVSFLCYCACNESPLTGFAAKEILESDVILLHIKEVETDEEEPQYVLFGDGKDVKTAPSIEDKDGPDKVNCNCDDCNSQDECDKYLYGQYCVAAMKRYFAENKYLVAERCTYQVFVAHYNRALEFRSYNPYHDSAGMIQTEITKPTYCIQKGSLKFALFWIRWQIENGPDKEYYKEQRAKKERIRMTQQAKDAAAFNNTITVLLS